MFVWAPLDYILRRYVKSLNVTVVQYIACWVIRREASVQTSASEISSKIKSEKYFSGDFLLADSELPCFATHKYSWNIEYEWVNSIEIQLLLFICTYYNLDL